MESHCFSFQKTQFFANNSHETITFMLESFFLAAIIYVALEIDAKP